MTTDNSSTPGGSNLKFLQDIVGSEEGISRSSPNLEGDSDTEKSDKLDQGKLDNTMETEQQSMDKTGSSAVDNEESAVMDSVISTGEKIKTKRIKKMKKKKKNIDKPIFPTGESKNTAATESDSVQSEPRTMASRGANNNNKFETMSDSTDIRSRPKRKLSRRTQVNRLEINPTQAIEQNIQQKYEELKVLIAQDFVCKQKELTGNDLQKMEYLRQQHANVSHGESLPTPRSSSQLDYYQDERENLSNDQSYNRIRQMMVSSSHHQHSAPQRPRTAPARRIPTSSNTHNAKLPQTKKGPASANGSDSTNQPTPRRIIVPVDNSLKNTDNVDIEAWLKQKNKLLRQKQREERKKKKEEQKQLAEKQKEKVEKKIESDKLVREWMSQKRKEVVAERKKKLEEAKVRAESAENLTRRPFSAPPRRSQSTGTLNESSLTISKASITGRSSSTEPHDEIDLSQIEDPEKRRELSAQIRLEEDSRVQSEKMTQVRCSSALPVRSTYLYKRPVSGKVRLKVQQKSNTGRNKVKDKKEPSKDEKEKEARMSYDQWLKNKRKDDIKKKREGEREQENAVSKSDPDLTQLVPDIAKKRVHTILSSKKRVDSGIRRYDRKVNKEFGGGDFNSGDDTGDEGQGRNKYRNLNKKVGNTLSTEDSIDQQETRSKSKLVPVPKKSASPRPASAGSLKVQAAMSVNTEQDTDNPFRLPFPPDLGAPKHVAERQKKLFPQKAFDDLQSEERPEPQGSDSPEHKAACPKSMDIPNNLVAGFVQDQQEPIDSWDGILTDGKKENFIDPVEEPKQNIAAEDLSNMFSDSIDSLLEEKIDNTTAASSTKMSDEDNLDAQEVEEDITPFDDVQEPDKTSSEFHTVLSPEREIEQYGTQVTKSEPVPENGLSLDPFSKNGQVTEDQHSFDPFSKIDTDSYALVSDEQYSFDPFPQLNGENKEQVTEDDQLVDSVFTDGNSSENFNSTTPIILKSNLRRTVEGDRDNDQQNIDESTETNASADSDNRLRKSVTFSETPPQVQLYESTELEDDGHRHVPSFFFSNNDDIDLFDDLYMYDGLYNYGQDGQDNMDPEQVRNMIESLVQHSFENSQNVDENQINSKPNEVDEISSNQMINSAPVNGMVSVIDSENQKNLDFKVPSLNLGFDNEDDMPNAEKTFLTSSDDPHEI